MGQNQYLHGGRTRTLTGGGGEVGGTSIIYAVSAATNNGRVWVQMPPPAEPLVIVKDNLGPSLSAACV